MATQYDVGKELHDLNKTMRVIEMLVCQFIADYRKRSESENDELWCNFGSAEAHDSLTKVFGFDDVLKKFPEIYREQTEGGTLG